MSNRKREEFIMGQGQVSSSPFGEVAQTFFNPKLLGVEEEDPVALPNPFLRSLLQG